MRKLCLLAVLLLTFTGAHAQKAAVAVNAGDLLSLGTMNVELDYGVARRVSLYGGVRINPWTFFKGQFIDMPDGTQVSRQTQLRHQTYSVGMRFWPWYVHSGWWTGVKLQYQEYNYGGFRERMVTEEGDAVGVGLALGYSLLLNHQWNLNFGLGAWAGHAWYTRYNCPYCGRKMDSGEKNFIRPNEVILALVYVF